MTIVLALLSFHVNSKIKIKEISPIHYKILYDIDQVTLIDDIIYDPRSHKVNIFYSITKKLKP